jgi:hypothetical protein
MLFASEPSTPFTGFPLASTQALTGAAKETANKTAAKLAIIFFITPHFLLMLIIA